MTDLDPTKRIDAIPEQYRPCFHSQENWFKACDACKQLDPIAATKEIWQLLFEEQQLDLSDDRAVMILGEFTASSLLTVLPNSTYIRGIVSGSPIPLGAAVFVDTDGRISTVSSSRETKNEIGPIVTSDIGSNIDQLRPITFSYKSDAANTIQYGLIAEEVDLIFPELVCRATNPETGVQRPVGLRYEQFISMLLALTIQDREETRAREASHLATTDQLRQDLDSTTARLNTAEDNVASLTATVAGLATQLAALAAQMNPN